MFCGPTIVETQPYVNEVHCMWPVFGLSKDCERKKYQTKGSIGVGAALPNQSNKKRFRKGD